MSDFVRVPPDSTGKRVLMYDHVSGSTDVYTQGVHIVDADDVSKVQSVNYRGAALVAFDEGDGTLTAQQTLRTNHLYMVGTYDFSTDSLELWHTSSIGTTSFGLDASQSRIDMHVDTNPGTSITFKTNRAHYIIPGIPMNFHLNTMLSDTGITGNSRRWGCLGDRNGGFFMISGSTLGVGIRSDAYGTVEEVFIPQSSWNGDKLDGTGNSGYTLTLDDINTYYIGGMWPQTIRFGVMVGSQRIICHSFDSSHRLGAPGYSTRELYFPIGFEIENETATAQEGHIYIYDAFVGQEGPTNYTFWRYADAVHYDLPVTSSVDPTYVFSFRSKLQDVNGNPNLTNIYPDNLNILVQGGPIRLTMYYQGSITSPSWTELEGSMEMDTDAVYYSTGSDGYAALTWFVGEGVTELEMKEYFELNDEGMVLLAGSNQLTATFLANALTSTPVTCSFSMTYKELR